MEGREPEWPTSDRAATEVRVIACVRSHLPRIASHCLALRCVALRCVALRCVALRCVALR
jgi:hypothetical protein